MGNSIEANAESYQIEGRIVLPRRSTRPQSSPTGAGGDAGQRSAMLLLILAREERGDAI